VSAATGKTPRKNACRNLPCKVCGGTSRCSIGEDGYVLCYRSKGEVFGFVHYGPSKGDSQFHGYREESHPVVQEREREFQESRRRNSPPANGQHANATGPGPVDWGQRCREYQAHLTPTLRTELADALGLPEAVLSTLGTGYSDQHEAWAFPESAANGQILGISLRGRDGNKRMVTGSTRGLIVPTDWQTRGGDDSPLYLPEGASGTLAVTALGLAAVGRPNNVGGLEQLALLLKDFSRSRGIIVLADFDPKVKTGEWPGRDGAVKTATQLASRLGRPVGWGFPPDASQTQKDSRDWATKLKALDPTLSDAWSDAGDEFRERVGAQVQTVQPEAAPEEPSPGKAPAYAFRVLDSAAFAVNDYMPRWLVRSILVRGQPSVFGGPRKSLKTSLLEDLALSLGSGHPFLGAFAVAGPARVALLSAESGGWALQETGRRVARAKGIDLAAADVLWGFELPQLASREQVAALADGLRQNKVEVAILDPLYLALLAGPAAAEVRAENLYSIGPLLLSVAKACLDVGCTPILCHHAKKHAGYEPLDLDALAYSGIAEFARQWLLVSRREAYQPGTGTHHLHLNVGGSVGHGGLWAVDVDEGQLGEDFSGRQWAVRVSTASAARQEERDSKQQEKRQQAAERDAEDDNALLAALDGLDPRQEGAVSNKVRLASGLSKDRFQRALHRLCVRKVVETMSVWARKGNNAKQSAEGVRRVAEEA
jgi:replicative DNA helicase